MWIALRAEGVGSAFIVDAKKSLWLAGRFDRIDRNSQTAVGAILKAKWHGETRGHLAVCLALGSTRTDCRPTDKVGYVLRGDWVEQLCRGRQTEAR